MVLTVREGRKALPLVDILTLSATGSEYDGGGVITNPETNEKLGGSYTYPTVSICDPTYTFTENSRKAPGFIHGDIRRYHSCASAHLK